MCLDFCVAHECVSMHLVRLSAGMMFCRRILILETDISSDGFMVFLPMSKLLFSCFASAEYLLSWLPPPELLLKIPFSKAQLPVTQDLAPGLVLGIRLETSSPPHGLIPHGHAEQSSRL